MDLIKARPSSHEIASSASAALAKATIEAKFAIAIHRPRSVMSSRAAILDACKRPGFAEGAMYRKKQGRKQVGNRWEDNYVEGLSIRFAEQALNAWKNVDVSAVTAWEDDHQRLVRITVTDLETNLSYGDELMLAKTVERRTVKEGQEILGERENSSGQKVYIVRATDEELANKVNAAKSKAIRNSGLRLIPQDLLEEAENAIRETRIKGGDCKADGLKKLADAFAALDVSIAELERFLKHKLEATTAKEIAELRAIYTALKDGEAKWSDYIAASTPADDVPMTFAADPKPQPEADKVTVYLPKEQVATETVSPQDKLAEVILGAGLTWEDLAAWGESTNNIPAATSLSGFADVSATACNRLLRNPQHLIEAVTAKKGVVK